MHISLPVSVVIFFDEYAEAIFTKSLALLFLLF